MKKVKVLITGGNGDIAKAIANELINDKENEYNVILPQRSELDVTDIEQVNNRSIYMHRCRIIR